MKKKKNRCGKAAVMAKRLKYGEKVKYKCLECGVEEDIPESIVKMFDIMDDGDISEPPTFNCKICPGKMRPIKYEGVHGITYGLTNNNSPSKP